VVVAINLCLLELALLQLFVIIELLNCLPQLPLIVSTESSAHHSGTLASACFKQFG